MRLAACLVLPFALLSPAAADDDLDVLAGLERQFAADVAELGIIDGFLRHLAEESVAFRPLPESARAWYQAQSAPDFQLSWQPWHADMAEAGDFGYTLGQWTSSPLEADARPDSHGWYVTVWIRDGGGDWRVLAEHGISGVDAADAPDTVTRPGSYEAGAATGTYALNIRYQSLLNAALRLPDAQAREGTPVGRDWLHADLVALRPGRPPLRGHEATRQVIAGELGASPPGMTVMAASADLGMSLGGEPGAGAYLRLWRHHPQAGWQLVVDVATPVQAAADDADDADDAAPTPDPGTG